MLNLSKSGTQVCGGTNQGSSEITAKHKEYHDKTGKNAGTIKLHTWKSEPSLPKPDKFAYCVDNNKDFYTFVKDGTFKAQVVAEPTLTAEQNEPVPEKKTPWGTIAIISGIIGAVVIIAVNIPRKQRTGR